MKLDAQIAPSAISVARLVLLNQGKTFPRARSNTSYESMQRQHWCAFHEPHLFGADCHNRCCRRVQGSGNLRLAVQLPEGEDTNEWLAVHGMSYFHRFQDQDT